MALRIVASRPDPAIVTLPWSTPLEEWPEDVVVPLARGLSRHVVRIVRLGSRIYAVKETQEPIAFREYRTLRDLQRLGLPAVVPQAVVTGREDDAGNELPSALLTEHLRFSLPYRSLFEHGLTADDLPRIIDALVVLLVRLHLTDFYWGDVSLSNVLFRRDAGGFAAYLVDAETGELRASISDRLRAYDLEVAAENVYAEILDLEASGALPADFPVDDVVEHLRSRYDALWEELTAETRFPTDEMWQIERRIERLNDLGFDVEELDIVTDYDGDTVMLRPQVVELGHHQRTLRALTGIQAEDEQARRMLNDIAAYTASRDLGGLSREVVAQRWLKEIYEPLVAMIPATARGKLEPAEIFHEILVHRWYLSERAGHSVKLLDAARDYMGSVLLTRPDEALTTPADAGV
jgi:tRNA A-37 threonylcarbamoyl transferase component Bud32